MKYIHDRLGCHAKAKVLDSPNDASAVGYHCRPMKSHESGFGLALQQRQRSREAVL